MSLPKILEENRDDPIPNKGAENSGDVCVKKNEKKFRYSRWPQADSSWGPSALGRMVTIE